MADRAARQGIEPTRRGTALAVRNSRRCAGSQPARGRSRNRRLLPAPRRSQAPPRSSCCAPEPRRRRRREPVPPKASGISPENPLKTSSPPPSASGLVSRPRVPLCPPGNRAASLSSVLRWKRLTRSSSPVSGKRTGSSAQDSRTPSSPSGSATSSPWSSSTPPRPCCAASSSGLGGDRPPSRHVHPDAGHPTPLDPP